MAREATAEEMANSSLRRILDPNRTFDCADFAIGDSVIFDKEVSRKDLL